jgi:hypothetical protein
MADVFEKIQFAEKPTNPRFVDLTGIVFGRLTVLGLSGWDKWGNGSRQPRWWCKCTCGTVKQVPGVSLKVGRSTSCGCYIREVTSKRVTTHGMRKGKSHGTPEYKSYRGAKNRCLNKMDKQYFRYGGRGIQFRFSSFDEFIQCVGLKPGKDFTLDRISNDGHYEPGNVRWASKKTQANNRRSTVYVTIDGITRGLAEWLPDQKQYRSAHYQIRKRNKNAEDVVKCFLNMT